MFSRYAERRRNKRHEHAAVKYALGYVAQNRRVHYTDKFTHFGTAVISGFMMALGVMLISVCVDADAALSEIAPFLVPLVSVTALAAGVFSWAFHRKDVKEVSTPAHGALKAASRPLHDVKAQTLESDLREVPEALDAARAASVLFDGLIDACLELDERYASGLISRVQHEEELNRVSSAVEAEISGVLTLLKGLHAEKSSLKEDVWTAATTSEVEVDALAGLSARFDDVRSASEDLKLREDSMRSARRAVASI